jgi:putative MATE family efflux protein
MPDSPERDPAAIQVESEIEELGDPEAAPALPSTTLAAAAAPPLQEGAARAAAAPGASTTAEILTLAWPVMLSGVLISLAGLVDRAMIGRLGGEAGSAVPLAAVGFATQFFFLIQSTLFAIGLSCVALMARAIGAGDPARAREALSASVQVAVAVTLVLASLMLALARPMLELLGAEPEVVDAAVPYLNFVVGSSLALGVALTLESALRANRDTRTPMWIALAVTVVKLVGNWVLIFGNLGAPRLELVGAGLATAISQVVGLGLLLAVVFRAGSDSPIALRAGTLMSGGALRREVVRIAMPGIAERIVMNLALLSYFWVLSRYYGTVSVAVYTVGVALLSFSWIPGLGYAQACATLVGQALGAKDPSRATRTGWQSAGLALGTAVVLGLVFAMAREPLARLFTQDAEVVAGLGPFMLALAMGQPFLQLHFTLGGAHRGAGDTWTPLVAATVGNWVFRVPVACFCAIQLETGVLWVWYALILDHAARSAYLTWTFRRGKWISQLDPRRPR